MMEEGGALAVTLIKGAIKLLVEGNRKSIEAQQNADFVKATIQLPDGTTITGQHSGGRAIQGGERSKNTLGMKVYILVPTGPGKFFSKRVTYDGSFVDGNFHDPTGDAKYYVDGDQRYTGNFSEGKRHGHGVLELYLPQKGEYYNYFVGQWKNDQPFAGRYFAQDGVTVIDTIEHGQKGGIGMKFGKADWEKYFGPVGEEPPLPADIDQILKSPCPYWPGKRVEETHALVFVPKTVNEKPLTLDLLGKIVQSPRGGYSGARYDCFFALSEEGPGPDQCCIDAMEQKKSITSHWVLLTKDVIPNTCGKAYNEQIQLLKRSYEVPETLDIVAAMFICYVKTGEVLYSAEQWTNCLDVIPYKEGYCTFPYRVHVGHYGGRPPGIWVGRNIGEIVRAGSRRRSEECAPNIDHMIGLGGVRKLEHGTWEWIRGILRSLTGY